jgi:hypothetical protein
MIQADSVHSTPPTNTSAIDQPMFPPMDPTRRRFLAVAAVASVVSAGTLAAAAAMDPSVPAAVTMPRHSTPDLMFGIIEAHRRASAAHGIALVEQARLEQIGDYLAGQDARVSIMAGITYFVALPFDVADGSIVVGEPVECPSAAAAIGRAEGLCKILGHTGAVAFSRTGDPATGDFSDAKVIKKFGDVADDLSAL